MEKHNEFYCYCTYSALITEMTELEEKGLHFHGTGPQM